MSYKCRSFLVLPETTYENIIDALMSRISADTPFLDVVDAYTEVIGSMGINGRLIRNLNLAKYLVAEAIRPVVKAEPD
jgi:hypothetical protein